MTTSRRATLVLLPERLSVRSPADAVLTLRLSNHSGSALWLSGRMALNRASAPEALRDVWLEVLGPAGQELPFRPMVHVARTAPEDYVRLEPGASLEQPIRISQWFDLRQPGVYRVRAHYEDGAEHPPSAPADTAHLKERLDSESAEIEILTALPAR